jgi:hypothetical protein
MEKFMRKSILLAAVCSALLGYAFGRWGHPVKVTETKVVEVERQDKSKITQVETVKPDGTRVIRTRTQRDVDTSRKTKAEKTADYGGRVGIAFLSGVHVHSPAQLLYGGHITAPVLGPIRAGAWGLSNGTLGVSLGLDF